MNALEKLLAPYAAATSGTPSTEESLTSDPIYQLLFPQALPVDRARAGQNGVPGVNAAPDLISLARQLTRKGFSVSELEGFHGQGPITSGHVNNSLHYSGDAADINYYGDGRWGNEKQALNWLYRFLNKRYDPQELLWQVPDHYDHLHIGGI